jgi:hypothetical protein
MILNYEDCKDGAPGADGLELPRQNLAWVLPRGRGEGLQRRVMPEQQFTLRFFAGVTLLDTE